MLAKIEAEIILGLFDYRTYFPSSKNVRLFSHENKEERPQGAVPSFKEFAEEWFLEKEVEWNKSHSETTRCSLDKYILPVFGKKNLDQISRKDIFEFRANLKKYPGQQQGATLSNSRVNHIMDPLNMILTEGSKRYDFALIFKGIKRLKVPKTKVQPFTLIEVQKIIDTVRIDFRYYFMIRFFYRNENFRSPWFAMEKCRF